MVTTRGQKTGVVVAGSKTGNNLPVRGKENDNVRVVVEIPVVRLSERDGETSKAKATRKNIEVIDLEDETAATPKPKVEVVIDVEEPAKKGAPVLVEVRDSEDEDDGVDEIPAMPVKKRSKSPAERSAAKKTPAQSSAVSKHKRFGSEEPEPVQFFSTAPEVIESEEGESSDDEVEEITAQDAGKIAAAKERDAAKAIEE